MLLGAVNAKSLSGPWRWYFLPYSWWRGGCLLEPTPGDASPHVDPSSLQHGVKQSSEEGHPWSSL